jgi:hypothetical protein
VAAASGPGVGVAGLDELGGAGHLLLQLGEGLLELREQQLTGFRLASPGAVGHGLRLRDVALQGRRDGAERIVDLRVGHPVVVVLQVGAELRRVLGEISCGGVVLGAAAGPQQRQHVTAQRVVHHVRVLVGAQDAGLGLDLGQRAVQLGDVVQAEPRNGGDEGHSGGDEKQDPAQHR